MVDLIEDVSTLTQINEKLLSKLSDVTQEAFLYHLQDLEENEIQNIDIGFGTITVQRLNEELIFNFDPSNYIKNHIFDSKCLLEKRVEDKLTKKILATYKELM